LSSHNREDEQMADPIQRLALLNAREGEAVRRGIGGNGGPPLTEVQAAIRNASLDAGTVYLNAPQVRSRYGNISDMTLWRWLHDEKLNFPDPHRINRRRFWKIAELTAWERTMAPDRPLPGVECDGAPEPEAA
jgi:hypothetical protein